MNDVDTALSSANNMVRVKPALERPPDRILMVPGPSNLHPRVQRALMAPLVGHKDPYYLDLMERVAEQLRGVFGTRNEATFALPATGTSGMEASLINLLELGDSIVVATSGYFGDRLVEIAERVGANVTVVRAEWGKPVMADEVEQALRASHAGVVAFVHGETSTGMRQPVEEISRVCARHGALLVVDAVASLGGEPLPCDELGVDVCFSGSQKCLGAPPGLAPITVSDRAMDRIRSRRTPVVSLYFDLSLHARYWSSEHIYHHTGPVLNVYALHEALCVIEEEGLADRCARHRLHAQATVAGLEALGVQLLVEPAYRLSTVIGVLPPTGLDEAEVRRVLADDFLIDVSGGLGAYTGRLWRIGIMGYTAQRRNVILLLAALESALARQGFRAREGAAVAAAEAVYQAS